MNCFYFTVSFNSSRDLSILCDHFITDLLSQCKALLQDIGPLSQHYLNKGTQCVNKVLIYSEFSVNGVLI